MRVPINLLVVEDSPDDAELLARELHRGGFELCWGRVDTEAAFLARLATRPEVIISDYSMPQFSGLRALELLNRHGADIPFILVSGTAGEEQAVEAMKRGASDYLLKDRIARLSNAVAQALEQQRLRTERLQMRHELERTGAALRESEARLAGIIASASDAIISTDSRQRIVLFNPAAERMFGYPAAAVLGEPMICLLPECNAGAPADFEQHFCAGPLYGRRADGSEFPLEASISQVDAGGQQLRTVILRDITERKHLEGAIAAAAETERARIARDLHDGLGQQLGGALFLSELLHRDLGERHTPEAARAGQVHRLIAEALQQTRDLARGLYPVPPEPEGLMMALQNLADGVTRDRRLECHFDANGAAALTDRTMATHLYRIAQEAVNNALKHSRTDSITIRLDREGDTMELSVRDFGQGLPAGTAPRGLGMLTMQQRARLIDGRLEVQPAPGGGLRVVCSVRRPWTPPSPEM